MSAKPSSEPDEDARIAHDLRQLALVDRIIGLEAQLAHLRSVTPGADEAFQRQVDLMRASATWRVGKAVLTPVRMVKWTARKLTSR